jgi:hypothetical protein
MVCAFAPTGVGTDISSLSERFTEEQLGPALDRGHVSRLRETTIASAAAYAGRSESRFKDQKNARFY